MPNEREPLHIDLTPQERAELDQAAAALSVSRSEALRRSTQAVGHAVHTSVLRNLADEGYVTLPKMDGSAPPPSAPVAPVSELLAELSDDRDPRPLQ